jgi:hypothetical protein
MMSHLQNDASSLVPRQCFAKVSPVRQVMAITDFASSTSDVEARRDAAGLLQRYKAGERRPEKTA